MSRLPKKLEQTLRAWIRRVGSDEFRAIREVFPGDTPSEHAHRRNCRQLVLKGLLEPEPPTAIRVCARRDSTDHRLSERFRCSE